jgi:ketosteroid isomerase-like protein
MPSTSAKDLFRRYVAVWESGDFAALDGILHPGYIGHPASGDRDAAGLRERIGVFRELFRDVRFTVEDQLAEGDRVATRMTARAIRASDGRPVVLLGHNISRIADGRIAEEWMTWEAAG